MERIIQKIGRINEYISILTTMQDGCISKFDKDPIFRGAMLHYLYLKAETCIFLAEMIIKKKSLRTPQSYSEGFKDNAFFFVDAGPILTDDTGSLADTSTTSGKGST